MTALKMTADEALALADQWCAGLTMGADSKGWGAILLVLAEEVRRLREKENSADMCLEAVHSARQCLSDHFGGNLAFLDDDLIRGVVKMHEETERQAQEIAALRADARAYEYLLHCDYLAAKYYLPNLDEAACKAEVRARHAAAIDAARAKEPTNGN